MNTSVKYRVERILNIDMENRETKIREVLGDLMVYCRDHDIRFEKILIDAILERID